MTSLQLRNRSGPFRKFSDLEHLSSNTSDPEEFSHLLVTKNPKGAVICTRSET